MALINRLINKSLFLDTAPFIYFIEGHSQYHERLLEVFKLNDDGTIKFQTSTLTLLEVLVLPLKLNKSDLAKQYEEILTSSPNIDIYDVDISVSKQAAELRAIYDLKTPDAIQLATAINHNADFFFTNDLDLNRVSEIEIITLAKLKD